MFECKVRNWWRLNKDWPDGLEPHATPWEQCRTRVRFNTEAEARDWCQEYNRTHKPGRLSRKAEYSEVKP
jgi:hypothetical protein